MSKRIPRSSEDDYAEDIIRQRQDFIEENTPARLQHTKQFSSRTCLVSPRSQ
jgi:hydroxymethylglutaryl-CoA reductase (NADPH)